MGRRAPGAGSWRRVAALIPLAVALAHLAVVGGPPAGAVPDTVPGTFPDRFRFAIGAQDPVGSLDRPAAVALALDGAVVAADTGNHRVQVFAADGAFRAAWGGLGRAEGRLSGPRGVAVGPDGRVIVADTGNHRIQVFEPDGTWVSGWGTAGDGPGQLRRPGGVAVAVDGRVVVADTGNHRIQVFEPDGTLVGGWGRLGTEPGSFRQPSDVAVAPEGAPSAGRVFVADRGNRRVQAFDPTGGLVEQWAGPVDGEGRFADPWAVDVASDGTLYVVERPLEARWRGPHRVQRLGPGGTRLEAWGALGTGPGQLSFPSGLAAAPGGRLVVADTGNHRIQVFDRSGATVAGWGGPGQGDGRFASPSDVAVAPDGSLVVLDAGGHGLQRFTAAGLLLDRWADLEPFLRPAGVTVAPDGTVFVADTGNHRVRSFTAAGEAGRAWGVYGSGAGAFIGPQDVAATADGDVLVTDHVNHRVQRFAANGSVADVFGGRGTGIGQLSHPVGLAQAAPGAADSATLVVDGGNARLQPFDDVGRPLEPWGGAPGGWLPGLADVAALPDGGALVTDRLGHRVLALDERGHPVAAWGGRGSGGGQLDRPAGLALAAGQLYVADGGNRRVQVFGAEGLDHWRVTVHDNRWLADRPADVLRYEPPDIDWVDGEGPRPGRPGAEWSLRAERDRALAGGPVAVALGAAGGARLWVGDALVVDRWSAPAVQVRVLLALAPGTHRLRVEVNPAGPTSGLRLSLVPAGDQMLHLPFAGVSR